MTDGTIQTLRHTAKDSVVAARTGLSGVSELLQGRPGLTTEQQVARLESALDLVDNATSALADAQEALNSALDVVEGREVKAIDAEVDTNQDALVAAVSKAVTEAVAAALAK